MRLVLPTARSPTTLILSLRRRSRKDSATPLPGSKGLRDDYQPVNTGNRTLGRDRTGGNPSSARGGIGFRTMDSGGGAKITLDQESFKALASDVRVGILKRLDVRRETVTDLSNLLSLSKPTLLEHLAFTLSVASGLAALALRFVGQRRRAQFFEQLGVA